MKNLYILSILMLLSSLLYSQTLLYDNGPLITNPGSPAWSVIQSPNNTFGTNNSKSVSYRVADNFSFTGKAWSVDSIIFFEYQTDATIVSSTFTSFNVRLWKGKPDSTGSTILWGDTTTNLLTSSYWSGIYRAQASGGGTTRPIMKNVCTTPSLTLAPGLNYWIDWQAQGSLVSGPWQPYITIVGQTTTGNAIQRQNGVWTNVLDIGSGFAQGFPFLFYGDTTSIGVNEVPKGQEYTIYPNPVSNELTIENSGHADNISFEILNSLGQVVYSGHSSAKTSVPVSDYPAGVYIIRIKYRNTILCKKLIKE
jgi:hypothetical protein